MTQKNSSQFIIYQAADGQTKIEVRLENETVWLTQKLMAKLFQVAKSTISEHVKHIYEEKELSKSSTVRNFRTVQAEGNRNVTRDVGKHFVEAEKEIKKIEAEKKGYQHTST
jgi:hypothetical protein